MEELRVNTDPHPTIKRIVVFGAMPQAQLEAVGRAVCERFDSLRSCTVHAAQRCGCRLPALDFRELSAVAFGVPLDQETLQIRLSHAFRGGETGGYAFGYVAVCHVFLLREVTPSSNSGNLYTAESSWVQMNADTDDYDAFLREFAAGRDFCKEATNGRFPLQYFLAQAAELAVSFVPGL